jgi:hypothetical protein
VDFITEKRGDNRGDIWGSRALAKGGISIEIKLVEGYKKPGNG